MVLSSLILASQYRDDDEQKLTSLHVETNRLAERETVRTTRVR